MCSPPDGRHVVWALDDLDGTVRAELATLWMEYAEGLVERGHVRTARLFAELSILAGAGTTEAQRVDAAFIDIIRKQYDGRADPAGT